MALALTLACIAAADSELAIAQLQPYVDACRDETGGRPHGDHSGSARNGSVLTAGDQADLVTHDIGNMVG
jgi:hypothetical protein